MTRRTIQNDMAVSPVVGVMLMLVVTIIIAAVVSAFAGGMGGNTNKAPTATIVAKGVIVNEAYDVTISNDNPDPVAGKAADIYVIFEHQGGDGINLNNIDMVLGSLKYPHEKTTLSTAVTPNADTTIIGDKTGIQKAFSKSWAAYLEGFPDHAMLISPGSQFVLHADFARQKAGSGSGNIWKRISWQYTGSASAFTIDAGDYLTFDIIDKASKKVISSGQVQVPDFAVSSS